MYLTYKSKSAQDIRIEAAVWHIQAAPANYKRRCQLPLDMSLEVVPLVTVPRENVSKEDFH